MFCLNSITVIAIKNKEFLQNNKYKPSEKMKDKLSVLMKVLAMVAVVIITKVILPYRYCLVMVFGKMPDR